jgi:hypothetical protein
MLEHWLLVVVARAAISVSAQGKVQELESEETFRSLPVTQVMWVVRAEI